ncbi:zinc-binding protein A33-like [Pristis pectinata]|uniref:zinc-binding protein A33-like n=1 Tax=Pristis pectinata TaxID=685728 RepID=UPI00223DA030|nr:zinc-binding protein A33-like [Pristis pectinata]
MATMNHLLNLSKDLSCSICLEFYQDPVFLDCGHTFCEACISSFWENGECSCPECRLFFPEKVLKPNRQLASIVENVRSLRDSSGEREWGETLRGFRGTGRNQPAGAQRLPAYAAALTRRIDELMHQFEGEFAELHQILDREEHEMKQRLSKRGEELQHRLTASHRPAGDNNPSLLQMIWNLLKEITTPQASGETRQENKVVNDILTGEFGGPLQHVVWKQMRKSIKPALTQLTLAPSSAHPRLILSESMTKICVGYLHQQLPKNSKRFLNHICVLGSKRFTSGKHYWEVEVDQGAKWTVGVVNESVSRHEMKDMTVQNGYWVISPHATNWIQSLFNFFAQTDRNSKHTEHLELQINPTKVGVYLDYRGGQVSFYNADNMSHLYTHSGSMSGTVLPFFGPGISANDQMRLLQPWW